METFKSQFVKDETSIGTTHLTKMQIDTDNSEPVLQRPYPMAMKHYDRVRNEISELLNAQVIHSNHSSWSAPIIVVPKGDGWNMSIWRFILEWHKHKHTSKRLWIKYWRTYPLILPT